MGTENNNRTKLLPHFIKDNMLWLGIILVAGLLSRIPHLLSGISSSTETMLTYFPTLAASRFEECARALLTGAESGDAFSFASPLYILLLVPVYASKLQNIAVFAFQSGFGIASAFLTYLLAYKSGASKILACLGALLWLFYAPAALYELALLPVSLLAMLIAVWALFELKRSSKGNTSFLHGFISGIIAGLRPPYILLGLFSVWSKIREKQYKNVAAMLFGLLIPLLVLSFYHHSQKGVFTPFASSLGVNLVQGHAEGASGFGPPIAEFGLIETPSEDIHMVGARVAAENGYTSSSEANKFWLEKALNWIIKNPSAEIRLLGIKLGAFFGYTPFDSYFDLERDIDADNSLSHLVLPRYLLMLCIVIGVLSLFILGKKGFGLSLPLIIALVTTLCFFHSERYWIPAIPVSLAAGAAGFSLLLKKMKTNPKRAIAVVVFSLLLMTSGFFWPTPGVPEGQYVYNRAVKAYNMGNYILALSLFEEAAEASPPGSTTSVYARMEAVRILRAYNMQDRVDYHTRLLEELD